MDEREVKILLDLFPGARRAAEGVLFDTPDGDSLHIYGLLRSEEGISPEELPLLGYCSKSEIIRLRSLRSAHDYLLRMRVNSIERSPRSIRVMTSRKSKYRDKWSLTRHYHSTDRFHKSYVELLSKKNKKLVAKIPAGLALVNEANAICIKSLVGDVIVASEYLLHFYYFMTIGFYGERFGIDWGDRLAALLIGIRIIKGNEALDFDLDPRSNFSASVERNLQSAVAMQMAYTFGHEYAHHLCGHMSPSHEAEGALANSNVASLVYSHELELEADLRAITLIEKSDQAKAALTSAAYSVFLYLHFAQMMDSNIRTQVAPSTHPAPIERFWALWHSLGPKGRWSKEDMDGTLELAEQLRTMLMRRLALTSDQDPLNFYGSIYLPSALRLLPNGMPKYKRDRLDF